MLQGTDVRFLRVLGSIAGVTANGADVLFSTTQRRILAHLAVAAPNAVPRADLVHTVWNADVPRTATQAIHNQISRIRVLLGEESILTVDEFYLLNLTTDADLFQQAATQAEELLNSGKPADAFDLTDEALGMWVSEPLPDLRDQQSARPMIDALFATAEVLRNTRLDAAIRAKRKNWALPEASLLSGEAPHDERRAALLAQALMLHGRRSEALTTIARMRRRLRTELGIEEGADLTAVEMQILHPQGAPSASSTAHQDIFVGRDPELRRTLAEIARIRPVLVQGELGIGVSRFLLEVRAQLSRLGLRVVHLLAEEYPDSAVSLVGEILEELGVDPTLGHGVFSKFSSFLETLHEKDPLVLIIDDAQFLGPSVSRVLQGAALHPCVRVILGAHGTELGFEGFTVVNLPGLDSSAIATIARSRGIDNPDKALFQHCGGNPTVLAALLDSIDQGSPMPNVPASSQELTTLAYRLIEPLSSRERRNVLLAAVAGRGYPRGAFDHIEWLWEPTFPAELIEWTPEDTLTFRHEAVRTTLYTTIPRGQVLEMHHVLGLAADAVNAPAATVAGHLLAAAEIDAERAIGAARAAAAAAAQHGAHDDSVRWLARAQKVDPGTDPTRSLALRIEYADALRLSGHPEHFTTGLAAVHDALELGDEDLIAQSTFTLLQLGESSSVGDLHLELSSLTQRAIAAVTGPDNRALIQGAASLAWSMTGNPAECRRLFDEAEAGSQADHIRSRVLPFAYLALGMPSDLARRQDIATELLEIAARTQDPTAEYEGQHLRFSVCLQEGDGDGTRHVLAEMQASVDLVGDVGRRWAYLYCAATVADLDGDDVECARLAEQAYSMFAPVSPARAAAAYYAQLLPLRTRQGRLSELSDTISGLVKSQPGIPAWHAAYALALAESGAAAEDSSEAVQHATMALDLAQEDFTWLACHVVGGRAAATLGHTELAQRYLRRLKPWAHLICWQGTCSYGPVATVLALLNRTLGDFPAAAAYARQSRDLSQSLDAPGYRSELISIGLL